MWRTIEEIPTYEINEDKVIRNIKTQRVKKEHRGNTGLVRLYKLGYHSMDPKDRKNEVTRKIDKLYYTAFPEKLPGKEVLGYPMYRVTEDGQVFGLYEAGYLAFGYNAKGYRQVTLRRDGRSSTVSVHRLVAIAFIDTHLDVSTLTVNHKDGDKQNNHISNLEWCTQSQNQQHAYDNGLADSRLQKVEASIDGKTWQLFDSFVSACKYYKVTVDDNMYMTAKKNSTENAMNRGKPVLDKPFRCQGVAFRYPADFKEI